MTAADLATYTRDGNALIVAHAINPEHTLSFRAEAIRNERTGVHARVSVLINNVTLAYDLLNVEQDKDRTHLVGRVKKQMTNGLTDLYPEAYLSKDLDLFCYGLYEAWIGQDVCELMGGFERARPPVQVARDLVVEDGGTIMFGPPERGKSWALMVLAVSIDAGLSTLFQVQKRRVLFINLERSAASVRNRLGLVNRALGLPWDRPLHIINRRGRTLADIQSAVLRSIDEHGLEITCLDSLTRAGLGDLNDNVAGNKAVDTLNGFGRGYIALAHTPRNDDSHVYGSVMQDAGADVMVRVASEVREPELGIALFRQKGTDLPPVAQPQVIALRFDEDGLCGVRLSKLAEFPELLSSGSGETKAQKLRGYMIEVGSSTATDAARATGVDRSTIAKLFGAADDYVRLPKTGKEQPFGLRLTQ